MNSKKAKLLRKAARQEMRYGFGREYALEKTIEFNRRRCARIKAGKKRRDLIGRSRTKFLTITCLLMTIYVILVWSIK